MKGIFGEIGLIVVMGIAMGLLASLVSIILVLNFDFSPGPAVRLGVFIALLCLVPLFIRLLRSQKTLSLNLEPGEVILKHGAATHLKKWPGRYGWLFLTNSRLYFLPGIFNIHRKPLEIRLNTVQSLGNGNSNFFNYQPFSINLKTAETFSFSATSFALWPKEISNALKIKANTY